VEGKGTRKQDKANVAPDYTTPQVQATAAYLHRYDKVQELALLHLLEKLEAQGAPEQTSVFVCCFDISQRVGTVIRLEFLTSFTKNDVLF
jgi:hypothetical protein